MTTTPEAPTTLETPEPKVPEAEYMKVFTKCSAVLNGHTVNFNTFYEDFENDELFEYYNDRVYYYLLLDQDQDPRKNDCFDTVDAAGASIDLSVLTYGDNKKYFKHVLPMVDYVLDNKLDFNDWTVQKVGKV